MRYTSKEDIAQRLRGRLQIEGSPFGATAAASSVDDRLIYSVAESVEARVDAALGQIYQLPIPCEATSARAIIRSIVEKLIIVEIGITHFHLSINPQDGGDAGFIGAIRKQAIEELQSLLWGHGVFIAGLMSPPPMGVSQQPLVLPEVPLLAEIDRPDTLTRNVVSVEKRTVEVSQWF
ncbi:MAG: hypothetical protein ACRDBG_08430 [Waterburya sp.]